MSLIPTAPANTSQDYRRRMALKLMMEGSDASPVQHWAQGLARLGQGALGGYEMYQADQKDRTDEADAAKAYVALLQGGAPTAQAAPSAPVPAAAPTQAPVAPPVSPSTPMASGAAPPVTGPRPGGPVMPSGKVWGDAEAEAAGLYEPSKSVKLASALSQPEIPAQAPMPKPAMPQMAQAVAQPVAAAQASDAQKAQIIQFLQSDKPAERQAGRALADQYIANQQQANKPTDEIREYEYAKRNPSFKDYKVDLKRAGAIQNQVVIDQKGEGEFSKVSANAQAKRFDELAADGQTARQMVSDIKVLTDLGKNIGTGKTAEFKGAIGPYAEALGVKVDGLSDIQAYEAVVNRLAPNLRVKGSGAQSDMELKNFLKSLPSLGNTPEGNEIASAVLTGLQENKIRASEIGSKALNGQIGRPEAEKMLRELPDPMGAYREYMKKNRGAPTAAGTNTAKPPAQNTTKSGVKWSVD